MGVLIDSSIFIAIAATALTHGYGVFTQNVRDFQRIPGLVVRQPDWS